MPAGSSKPKAAVVLVAFGRMQIFDRVVLEVEKDPAVGSIYVVDNGSNADDVLSEVFADRPPLVPVTRVKMGYNAGFGRGCNLGSALATEDVLVFLNTDVVVAPNTISKLLSVVVNDKTKVAIGTLIDHKCSSRINAVGTLVHPLGLAWTAKAPGGVRLSKNVNEERLLSGALFAIQRQVFESSPKFDEDYLAYYEDILLSVWLKRAGFVIEVVPDALGYHDYDFARHDSKMFLLERNRIISWFALNDWTTISILLPLFLAQEFGVILNSIREGYFLKKLAAYWSVLHSLPKISRLREEYGTNRLPHFGSFREGGFTWSYSGGPLPAQAAGLVKRMDTTLEAFFEKLSGVARENKDFVGSPCRSTSGGSDLV